MVSFSVKKSKLYKASSVLPGQILNWRKILIRLGFLIILIVLLNIFQSLTRNTFLSLVSPVSESFYQAGKNISGSFGFLTNLNNINNQNGNLTKENQNLLSQIALLQSILKENHAQVDASQNLKGSNFRMALVKVIGLNTQNDIMTINKGLSDGISENMPIISSQKVLYGKVAKVYNNFSQVSLISSKDSVLDAKINQNNPVISGSLPTTVQSVYGAIKGSGSLSLYLDLVDSSENINTGDTVITSGLEGIFPSDLLIGTINTVNKNDAKAFQTAQIRPFFDVKSAEDLFVITNYIK